MPALLETENLAARYGQVTALRPTSLTVAQGEMVAVLGPNGAGKSTLLRAIMGLVPTEGRIRFAGRQVEAAGTQARARDGLIMVPEGRGIFAPMTVAENLSLGAYVVADAATRARRLDDVLKLFPRLQERMAQRAGSLSGGEQQMLAIGRALMAGPVLLMLDEPSLGLAPRMISDILEALGRLNQAGLSILIVEQKAPLALRLASRAYVLASGRVVAETTPDQIRSHHDLAQFYLA
jgi:branched-chain amino acid transport system ATP-binding protein